ncbi:MULTISPECIES: CHASE domain-containing protein [unclassified Serratia (in: enterobacteria)]|uniref:PAS domain-containing hybrid sensor histidine kinase/response regulator n=1 Tax=unclassified Serratia (in: enterobacteria) TaxID=2647522 RepID=UPI0005066BA1|nr:MULTISPECIES: CHASE domain-containing protein [unclassified Serratia (in: enterobacteria)]KFK91831.1 histidine kinase [Serratia sp. Ag2]KFK93943.1 histidine kinase [Serratia sp. Ag1]
MAPQRLDESTRTQKGFSFWDNYLAHKVNFLPVLLFIVGVIFSGVGAWRVYNDIEHSAKAEFQRNVERISDEIVRRFSQPVYGLNGAKGAYATNNDLNREQFHAYVASHNLSVEFPGVRGFGFIQRVQRSHLDEFLARVRADGDPEFSLTQFSDKHYNDLYIVKYIEPAKDNHGTEGIDVGSETVRREAILAAINTGQPTLSGSLHLVQDDRKTPGVLLFVPVYAYGSNPVTPEERQASLVGLLYSPIIIADLLHNIPEFSNRRVDIELFDSTDDFSKNNLVFDADGSQKPDFMPKEEHSNQVINTRTFRQLNTLPLPGREMTLRVTSIPSVEALTERYAAWLLLGFGVLLSSALALLLRQQINGRHRAEMLARNMTADLERLALVAKNTSNAVVITDVDRRIVWVNEGFERITGYSKNESLGQSPGRLLQCANTDKDVAAAMKAALDAGEAFTGELINRSKSGQEYWIELEIQPRYNDQNEPIGFMAIESDISERKATYMRLEEALRENNALLSTLNLHGIISSADRDGLITEVNDAFCNISGYRREELIGQNYRLLDSHTHSTEFWQAMWKDIASGISWRAEICNRAKDGRIYWVDTTIAPFKNSAGEIERYISIQIDITNSKNQQANLTIARNQLIRAADVAELGIWFWNIPDKTFTFDERMNDIYALPAELCNVPIPQESWYNLLHPEDRQEVTHAVKMALESENVYRQNFRIVINGQIRFIQSSGMVERDENGRPVSMMGINRDVTQQHEDENILRVARQAAEAANHAKSAFLATMSHELRTPMNAILGMMTLLRKTGLNHKQADYAIKIEAAARTLLRLLNDILDFSKIESGKMVLECIPFDIHTMLRDLSVILSSNLRVKNVEVLFDIDPGLPSFVIGDGMRLQQILINLGGNALKFTEQGEVILFIKVVKQDDQQVTLHFGVRDTGIGIAPEHQERIFSGFTQAEASISRRFGGSGLGLVISQRFVALMGGTLELESQVGSGSLFHFTITLPLPERSEVASEAPEPLSVRAHALNYLRVLVVDDNPTACDLIKRMGESLKWTVDVANSGSEALQLMKQQQEKGITYGALFIDWQMPGLDGWQTSKSVRELMPEGVVPMIVMITAHDREMLLQRSEEDQALLDGYLVKPITASMLLDSVTDALSDGKQPEDVPARLAAPSQQLSGIRLLVVEDNVNNQQIARELLEDEGAIVQIANHGQEAIEILQDNLASFDVVLMDLQMPVMDGLSATQYIRSTLGLEDLPIIAMTANAMASDRDACLAAGMNDHIGKPFDLGNLIRVIRKYSKQPELAMIAHQQTLSPLLTEWKAAAAVAGIELESALNRLGGDVPLLQKMLSLFSAELADFSGQLDTLIAQQDWRAASRLLHTVKGLAAQLGATHFSQNASQGETLLSGESVPAPEALESLLSEIKDQARSVQAGMVELSRMLLGKGADAASAGEGGVDSLDSDLNALILLLQNSDMAALEAMDQLQATFGHQVGEALSPLSHAINQLDFALAIQIAQALLDSVSMQRNGPHDNN